MVILPADNHVHSEFSYDTSDQPTMAGSCEQALKIGLPSLAFTEHLEFIEGGDGDAISGYAKDSRWWRVIKPLDVQGYLAAIDECRQRYPELRILSGIEAGEAHLFAASAGAVVAANSFDRVLGSLHSIPHDGRLVSADSMFGKADEHEVMRRYFAELLRLIEGSGIFEVLGHLDFPRRYWPSGPQFYREEDFEAEYRAVLKALAASGRVLEINTKSPLASVRLLRWWRAEGGSACSFGSDAHYPQRVGARFTEAVQVAEAAGFQPGRDPFDFWRA